MKIALLADSHFGCRNDSLIFAKHHKRFYEDVFFPTIDDRGIDTIIHVGDVTDRRKYINYITAKNLEDTFMKPVNDRGIKLHVILGNHDCFHKNNNDVNSMRQLYGTSNYDNLIIYENDPVEIIFDGVKIMLCPWISPDNQVKSMKAIYDTKAQILMAHLSIEGFEMNRGSYCDHGYSPAIFDKFDVVYSGHFHQQSTQGNITYLGAPYEMNWSDYDCKRGFHIFDTETRTIEFIPNPYRIFHKINYVDHELTIDEINNFDMSNMEDTYVKIIVGDKHNPYMFDLFLDALGKANCADIKVVDDHMNFDVIVEDDLVDEAQDTFTIMKNYVNAMETNVDKALILDLLNDLHNEALNL
ncbi:MAG: hypothetical protein COA84_13305 [Robiginitomaculum sp.]|nr:MAG: hypothetical protein COA84_13305 [Robiginitomaculum sp.]